MHKVQASFSAAHAKRSLTFETGPVSGRPSLPLGCRSNIDRNVRLASAALPCLQGGLKAPRSSRLAVCDAGMLQQQAGGNITTGLPSGGSKSKTRLIGTSTPLQHLATSTTGHSTYTLGVFTPFHIREVRWWSYLLEAPN